MGGGGGGGGGGVRTHCLSAGSLGTSCIFTSLLLRGFKNAAGPETSQKMLSSPRILENLQISRQYFIWGQTQENYKRVYSVKGSLTVEVLCASTVAEKQP